MARSSKISPPLQTCFISFLAGPLTTTHTRNTCHQARTTMMCGKGFGKPREPPHPKTPDSAPPIKSRPPPERSEPFVPRGPTLRKEYEDRGLIEPSITPDAGTLPEIVADRMLRRILGFAGVPLILLFGFFAAYFTLKYKYDITVIPAVVGYSTLGTIALAGAGITYGIFSSSWDEDIEGTKLGWEEATTNIVRAKDGLFGAREREKREDEFDKIDRREEERRATNEQAEDNSVE